MLKPKKFINFNIYKTYPKKFLLNGKKEIRNKKYLNNFKSVKYFHNRILRIWRHLLEDVQNYTI